MFYTETSKCSSTWPQLRFEKLYKNNPGHILAEYFETLI